MELDEPLLRAVRDYHPSLAAIAPIRQVPLLFVAGISGAGKETVLKALVEQHPAQYAFLISHTTRKPRENRGIMEQEGKDYYFIDVATAQKMLDDGQYLEANAYAGNIYGTTIPEVARIDAMGVTGVCAIDVNGVAHYMALGMDARPIFLLPPSYDVWLARLMGRYTDGIDEVDLRKRMQTALEELHSAIEHQYFNLVVNDVLDATVSQVHAIAQGDAGLYRPASALTLAKEIADQIATGGTLLPT